jgi:hypothetical protein
VLKGVRSRHLLGIIRLANGSLALFAPKRLLKMLRVDPDANGPAIYALRLFGVRTILIGLQLFVSEGEVLETAVRDAVLIHGSDTAAAALAGLMGDLSGRAAVTATAISSVNTALAVLARRTHPNHE